MSKTFFTADLHFGHANVIQYAKRPFADVDEMNAALIANWNAVVGDQDEVWLLGDVAMISSSRAIPLVKQLRGRKHLIRGNHDRQMNLSLHKEFETVDDYRELKAQRPIPSRGTDPLIAKPLNPFIVLCHYPFATWNGAHHGSWCLHGHSHGTYRPGRPDVHDGGKILDVGVDCHNFRPIDLEEVADIMQKKQFRVVDHHGGERSD